MTGTSVFSVRPTDVGKAVAVSGVGIFGVGAGVAVLVLWFFCCPVSS